MAKLEDRTGRWDLRAKEVLSPGLPTASAFPTYDKFNPKRGLEKLLVQVAIRVTGKIGTEIPWILFYEVCWAGS